MRHRVLVHGGWKQGRSRGRGQGDRVNCFNGNPLLKLCTWHPMSSHPPGSPLFPTPILVQLFAEVSQPASTWQMETPPPIVSILLEWDALSCESPYNMERSSQKQQIFLRKGKTCICGVPIVVERPVVWIPILIDGSFLVPSFLLNFFKQDLCQKGFLLNSFKTEFCYWLLKSFP